MGKRWATIQLLLTPFSFTFTYLPNQVHQHLAIGCRPTSVATILRLIDWSAY